MIKDKTSSLSYPSVPTLKTHKVQTLRFALMVMLYETKHQTAIAIVSKNRQISAIPIVRAY